MFGIGTINKDKNSNLTTLVSVISLVLPVVGAILYYAYKKKDDALAKIANKYAWIGGVIQTSI